MPRRNGRNAKSPAYQWYPGDAMSDTAYAGLSLEEEGAWRRLYDFAWMNDGLPEDEEAIRRLLRCDARTFARIWPAVSLSYPVADDGRRRNPRQERERLAQSENRNARRDAAKAGNAVRWGSQTDRNAIPLRSDLIAPVSRIPYPVHSPPTPSPGVSQPAGSAIPQDEPDPTQAARWAAALSMHPTLDTPDLRAALARWEAAQAAENRRPWTSARMEACLLDWERWGVAATIQAIDDTIRTGHATPFRHKHSPTVEARASSPPAPKAPPPPADEKAVERAWHAKHEVDLDVPKPGGGVMRVRGPDRKYPGYQAAKAELETPT